jgi:hypothetical protein
MPPFITVKVLYIIKVIYYYTQCINPGYITLQESRLGRLVEPERPVLHEAAFTAAFHLILSNHTGKLSIGEIAHSVF